MGEGRDEGLQRRIGAYDACEARDLAALVDAAASNGDARFLRLAISRGFPDVPQGAIHAASVDGAATPPEPLVMAGHGPRSSGRDATATATDEVELGADLRSFVVSGRSGSRPFVAAGVVESGRLRPLSFMRIGDAGRPAFEAARRAVVDNARLADPTFAETGSERRPAKLVVRRDELEAASGAFAGGARPTAGMAAAIVAAGNGLRSDVDARRDGGRSAPTGAVAEGRSAVDNLLSGFGPGRYRGLGVDPAEAVHERGSLARAAVADMRDGAFELSGRRTRRISLDKGVRVAEGRSEGPAR